MPVDKGQRFSFYIADSSMNYDKVGETREKEINRSKETLDKSSDDRPDDATFVGALREGEVTISGLYDWSDTGQQLIESTFKSDSPTNMKLEGGGGDPSIQFSGHITEWNRTFNTNELSVFELTISTDGSITETTV